MSAFHRDLREAGGEHGGIDGSCFQSAQSSARTAGLEDGDFFRIEPELGEGQFEGVIIGTAETANADPFALQLRRSCNRRLSDERIGQSIVHSADYFCLEPFEVRKNKRRSPRAEEI